VSWRAPPSERISHLSPGRPAFSARSWHLASGGEPPQETNPETAIVCHCRSRHQIPAPQGDRLRWFLLVRLGSPCSRTRARDFGSSLHQRNLLPVTSKRPSTRRPTKSATRVWLKRKPGSSSHPLSKTRGEAARKLGCRSTTLDAEVEAAGQMRQRSQDRDGL
jgi:hypothetical protein